MKSSRRAIVHALFRMTPSLTETMPETMPETIGRADRLYASRRSIEAVRKSVRLLENAPEPLNYEALWRLGRALFFLGQESDDEDESRLCHGRAVGFCERAARLEPRRVEGHFWLGVNRALLAQSSNLLSAPLLALRARRSLERAARLDAAYHGAGPLRVLARLEARLPAILGGGTRRAQAHFEQAIRLAPSNTVTRIYFAEMLLESGQRARARNELEALLSAPPDPAWAFETARDRALARARLEEMRGRE